MDQLIIVRLLLVNYQRFNTSGITRFLFTPDQDRQLQLILGSNGSGKSSLMNEMWPLPADKESFGPMGRKELDIQYKGKFYELVSSFDGKPNHEFKVDGIDLNDGGKIEMFRALCLEHFGVTSEIRALALEKDPLSGMAASRRRYWLVKLADTDFSYAMAIYQKLQVAHRDAQGAIKRLQKRLVDENLKLPDDDVINVLSAETHEIKGLINEIYELRNAQARKGSDILDDLNNNAKDLEQWCNEAGRLDIALLQSCGFDSRESMLKRKEHIKIDIEVNKDILQSYYANHSKVKKKYDLLIKAGTETAAELEIKKKDAEDLIAGHMAYIVMKNVVIDQDPVQMSAVLRDILPDLYERLTSLPSNDGYYSREKAEITEQKLTDTRGALNALQGRISRLSSDLTHRRDHVQQDSLSCPKCQHTWSAKASEADLKRAEQALEELKVDFTALKAKEDEFAKYMKEYSEYAEAYRAVTMLMRTAPILRNYFNEVTQNGNLIKHPGNVASDLHVVQSDLEHHVEIKKQKDILQLAVEQIELKKNLDADTIENIEKDLQEIETATSFRTFNLTKFNEELKSIENLIRMDAAVVSLRDKMIDTVGVQQQSLKGYVYSRYQELLWTLIMTLQTQLARKEDALAQINGQKQILTEIQAQLDEAIMNEAVAKMAHVALSPTNGAIAEGLFRFTNIFVARMNKVINAIWSYPLEIQTFQMGEGQTEMDYKFPFRINKNPGPPAKDVIEGSESMINIFDFGFRVCALKQLGLGHLPLFLDEFESAFDDLHRERTIYFVKKLLDEQAYGQIFMISHYESNHGALSNLAQTCVLSKDNLLLPSDIVCNEHVTMS